MAGPYGKKITLYLKQELQFEGWPLIKNGTYITGTIGFS
jgi:hypothetical protein